VPTERRRRKSPEPVPGICTIPGCRRLGYSRQWCQAHYSRWARTGDPLPAAPRNPNVTFWERVIPTGFCWEWNSTLTNEGYGVFTEARRQFKAHRRSYELLLGPIPDGLHLDHLCRNRKCVNPDHLEPVTSKVNALRGFSPMAKTARKTHCTKGHEYTPENTRICPDGGRDCRTCDRDRKRKERAA
jgi:hypothetical protein